MATNETTREGRVIAAVPEDTYARRLMLTRDHAGRLSIREAADRCGLNYGTWAAWERGAGSRTKVEDAQIIAETLGVDLDWLLQGGPLTRPERTRRLRLASVRFDRPGVRRPRRIDRIDRRRVAV